MSADPPRERFWSDDGYLLIAPDMNTHVEPVLIRAAKEYGSMQWVDGWGVGAVVFASDNASVKALAEEKLAIIVLPNEGIDDMNVALAFLAHELVHCLNLDGLCSRAPMIEEGAAVRFSIMEAERRDPGFAAVLRCHQTSAPWTEHYAAALLAVEDLLAMDAAAIRKLRTVEPAWASITPQMILDVVPGFSPEVAVMLCEVREMRPDWEGDAARAVMATEGW